MRTFHFLFSLLFVGESSKEQGGEKWSEVED